jgi:hypothetical protein
MVGILLFPRWFGCPGPQLKQSVGVAFRRCRGGTGIARVAAMVGDIQ